LDACVCSVQHSAPCNLQRVTHWRGSGGLLLFEQGGKRRALSTKCHAPNQAIISCNGFIIQFDARDCGPSMNKKSAMPQRARHSRCPFPLSAGPSHWSGRPKASNWHNACAKFAHCQATRSHKRACTADANVSFCVQVSEWH